MPATVLAPRLLGACLTSGRGSAAVTVRLTEVEAYEGTSDPASHAFRGPTPRTAVMFGPPAHLYVYFVYGMHWCANLVCGPDGAASALLLRAGEVVDGVPTARARRPSARRDADLARGPARLAQCLGLTGDDNGVDVLDPNSRIRVSPLLGAGNTPGRISAGPRVGVAVGAEVALRFWLAGDPTVSAYRPGARKRAPGNGQT